MRIYADETVPNGLTRKDSKKIVRGLAELGIIAIHISVGNFAALNHGYMMSPMSMSDAPLIPFADWVNSYAKVPVIAVRKIRSPELADKILREGKADFIAIGRTLLADPDWPKKAQKGRAKEIRSCIACIQG